MDLGRCNCLQAGLGAILKLSSMRSIRSGVGCAGHFLNIVHILVSCNLVNGFEIGR